MGLRATVGYNDRTAIVETANAYNTMAATPTVDEATPIPTLSPTSTGTRYEVVAVAGMNVRARPDTGSNTVGYLRFGEMAIIGEHRVVDIPRSPSVTSRYIWGAVSTGGWVAIVYDPDINKAGDQVIYLRARW